MIIGITSARKKSWRMVNLQEEDWQVSAKRVVSIERENADSVKRTDFRFLFDPFSRNGTGCQSKAAWE